MTDSVKPEDVEKSKKTEMTGQVQEHSENDKEFAQNSEPSQTVSLKGCKDANTVQTTDNILDVNTNIDIKLELTGNDQHNDLLKVVGEKETKKKYRPKKKKRGRPPTYDVYANMPPGLSRYQIEKLAKERKIQARKEQLRAASRTYLKKLGVEQRREMAARYKRNNPERVAEISRESSAKYKRNNPEKAAEINRKSSAKYASRHPEVARRASKKFYEKKKLEKLGIKVEVSEVKVEVSEVEVRVSEVEVECESILGF